MRASLRRPVTGMVAALVLVACNGPSQAQSDRLSSGAIDCVGDVNLITYTTESEQSAEGSSSSSRGQNALQETILSYDADGMTVHVDFPNDVTDAERATQWQFPAVIHRAHDGTLSLENLEALEARLDTWLDLAGFGREACGEWIFTWNAFEIVCDPASVIEMYTIFDMRRFDLRDGAPFKSDLSPIPSELRRMGEGTELPASYKASLVVDGDVIKTELAEQDVVVSGFVSETPLSFEDALAARADDVIAGTLNVTLEVDENGRLDRQIVRQNMTITDASGQTKRTESHASIVRELIADNRTDAGLCQGSD